MPPLMVCEVSVGLMVATGVEVFGITDVLVVGAVVGAVCGAIDAVGVGVTSCEVALGVGSIGF